MRKIDVVTGGAGFIGSHLCSALLRQGRHVRVVDNFSSGKAENLQPLLEEHPGKLEVFEKDIRGVDDLRRVFEGADTVYHQAAVASVQKSVEDPVCCNSVNVEGTLKVLVAARDVRARKVIFASSSAVYGDSENLPKHEKMTPQPISPYALSKYFGELCCGMFSQIYHLSTLSLRYFNVFGPRQDPESEYAAVIPRFIVRMLAGEQPVIFGDGEQSRDFIFVDNVIAANLLAAGSEVQGVNLNIAGGQSVTLNQLVQLLNEILDVNLHPIYQAARVGDVRHSKGDISKAGEQIGFEQVVSFEDGLKQAVQSFREKATAARR